MLLSAETIRGDLALQPSTSGGAHGYRLGEANVGARMFQDTREKLWSGDKAVDSTLVGQRPASSMTALLGAMPAPDGIPPREAGPPDPQVPARRAARAVVLTARDSSPKARLSCKKSLRLPCSS
eukprot:scaffold23500_cov117-Isochrysis_galbana.AAC.5